MPLESLSDEQINIHDLTLEQEKKSEPESRKLYESLKKSAFYDPQKEKWNESLNNDQTVHQAANIYSSEDQLLATLVEAGYDKNEGIGLYNKLKSTSFFDSNKKQWRAIDNKKGTGFVYKRTFDQLLNILIETNIDKTEAVDHYNNLEALTSNNSGKEDIDWGGDAIISGKEYEEMLRTLIEHRIGRLTNKVDAQNLISKIKTNQKDYSTKSLLFSVLVEAQFNCGSAKNRFEYLKQTPLYDPEKKLWKQQIKPKTKNTPRFDATDQFVGLLCEQEFEEPKTELESPAPQLPETRSY